MKIRSDFVTNSSSSSYVLEIAVVGKDGTMCTIVDNPWDYNEDCGGEASFYADITEAKKCNTVEELAKFLYEGIDDDDFAEDIFIDKLYEDDENEGLKYEDAVEKYKAKLAELWEEISADDEESSWYDMYGGCEDEYDVDDIDDEYGYDYLSHQRNMIIKKKKFIRDMLETFKSVEDIKEIRVDREYSAWGEFADLVADNDETLCKLSAEYLKAEGDEKVKAREALINYINTPFEYDGFGGSFGQGFMFQYEFVDGCDANGEDNLDKLAKRLGSNYGPGGTSGSETTVLDMTTGKVTKEAIFNLE